MYILYLLILFIIILSYNSEGYINHIYDSNMIRSNGPDDTQYYACRQDKFSPGYPFQKYPNSNYRIKKNMVGIPQKGAFSAFLDSHNIRNYDHFYHAPICEDDNESYDFNTNIDSQFRLIPGAFPEENIQEIYKEETKKDLHDLRNPYYIYGNPEYIGNKIIYNNDIQNLFIKVKSNMDKHHEDSRHLIHEHQYNLED